MATPTRRRKFLIGAAASGTALLEMTASRSFGAEPPARPDPDFHVYLAFGQSNMEGFPGIEAQDKSGVDPRFQMLAAVDFMDPARKQEFEKAKQRMLDALKQDAKCDRAHYQLGVIARVEGDMDRAERHFQDAVKANPKHLEANQELRLIEMRKRRGGGKRGLFS
jgi:tetratricopeptide (TPR) repeat protein